MPSVNREDNVILNWSVNCVISNTPGATAFLIIDTKLYIPVVPLAIKDNSKLLQQLNLEFERTTYYNKSKSNGSRQTQSHY